VSPQQRAALQQVADGRVTWGDAYPARGFAALGEKPHTYVPTHMLDGSAVYGGQHATFRRLVANGLITDDGCEQDGTPSPVALTAAGRAALDADAT